MKKKSTVILSFVLTLTLLVGALPFHSFSVSTNTSIANILFTNDTRGYTEDLSYIKSYKEHTPNSILINCADFTKGSAEASLSNARYSSYLMHEAKYDLISIGVDDFSYGNSALVRIGDYANCDMLSGNVTYSKNNIFQANAIKEVNGVKIGFFSITDANALNYIPTTRVDSYAFSEEYAFAQQQVNSLKDKCDIIICLASFMKNDSDFTFQKLAEKVDGISAIICSNTGKEINETVSDCLILSAGEKLDSLGMISVGENDTLSCNILPKYNYFADNKPTENVIGTYREYGYSPSFNTERKKYLEQFNKTVTEDICNNKATIYAKTDSFNASLVEETPLGDIFTDAMTLAGEKIKNANSEYKNCKLGAVFNGSAMENNLAVGKMNLLNIFEAENYADSLYYYVVDADFLYSLMEQSVEKLKFSDKTGFVSGENSKFLQISGFNVIVNPKNSKGEKIESLYIKETVNDEEKNIQIKRTDKETKFLLAVNEETANGNSGYNEFLKLKPVYVGDFLTNALRTYIASNITEESFVSYGTDGRISFSRINELQPNGDAWATADAKFETYAAANVLLDGIDNVDCMQVDENGEVRLTMKTGAHGLSINGENIYASTVTGVGIKKNSITPIVDYTLYYKVLDDAYNIDESKYKKEAVDGYFSYLERAYVETKLTKEDNVICATQDVYDVWDAFLNDPDSFIDDGSADEVVDSNAEKPAYPSLNDFEYKGEFSSNTFSNTPVNSSTLKASQTASQSTQEVDSASNVKTGEKTVIILSVMAVLFISLSALGLVVLLRHKNKKEMR